MTLSSSRRHAQHGHGRAGGTGGDDGQGVGGGVYNNSGTFTRPAVVDQVQQGLDQQRRHVRRLIGQHSGRLSPGGAPLFHDLPRMALTSRAVPSLVLPLTDRPPTARKGGPSSTGRRGRTTSGRDTCGPGRIAGRSRTFGRQCRNRRLVRPAPRRHGGRLLRGRREHAAVKPAAGHSPRRRRSRRR